MQVPISAVEATLGTTIEVPTCHGDVELKVPAGTQPNTRLRIKGYGVPYIGSAAKGDQYVELKVVIPTKLTISEKELYEKLAGKKHQSPFEKFKENFK